MLYDFHSATLLYRVISIICQSLVYGIYLCLFPIAIYVIFSRRSNGRSRTTLFVTMVVMFALSTIYWVMSVLVTFLIMRAWFSNLDPATHSPPDWLPMFSAVLLVNFLITDAVVVWRAWVICSDQKKVILMTPVALLALDILAYLTTVVVRVGLLIAPEGSHTNRVLARVIDIAQVTNVVLSLLTNLVATSIIAFKSWKYRKSLIINNVDGCTSTKASKVLVFLVESGMLYILVGIVILASTVIRVCFATLGDILAPVGVQLAGIYPIIVLIVVYLTNTFEATSYFSSGSIIIRNDDDRASQISPLAPVSFTPGTSDSHEAPKSSESGSNAC